ncbi:MAG TPA: polysaccharide deacetylase family protein [Acidimicrobiia bacterium]|nr:polysaccharide deacetylase family protein [Acidimicrobiia bacterium]
MAAHGRVVGLEEAIGRVADSSLSDHFVLTFDDGYAGVWTHAFPLLRERGWPFTIYLTTHPIESQKSLFDAGDRPLTWDQIATMMETGLVTVGAHTHTHPDLRNSSDDRTIEELSLSDDLIEQRLGRLPQHFAYPWGYWSPQAHRLVRARYTSAALGSGPADVTGLAEGTFHRIPVMASDGPLLFRRRMFGGFRLEDQMRRLVKGYDGL